MRCYSHQLICRRSLASYQITRVFEEVVIGPGHLGPGGEDKILRDASRLPARLCDREHRPEILLTLVHGARRPMIPLLIPTSSFRRRLAPTPRRRPGLASTTPRGRGGVGRQKSARDALDLYASSPKREGTRRRRDGWHVPIGRSGAAAGSLRCQVRSRHPQQPCD